MPEDLSTKTALVYDHGFFLPIAKRLSESFKRVLYYRPWEKAYPVLNDCIIGFGMEGVECCNDFWPLKDEIDLFVFPDIYHRGLQAELRSQGKAVWGAGDAMTLETDRKFFLETLEELLLDVPEYEPVTGITALRDYLWDKEDIYIKMSKFRGSFETKHWENREKSSGLLDVWAVRFGGAKEIVEFLCFPAINTPLEIGGDTFNILGEWPDLMLHGIEKKDEAYFGAVTPKSEMPVELIHIMDAFSPVLKKLGMRCQWSMEVRVKGDENFFTDATTRGGLPSTASQILSMTNFPEVIWSGAHGELVQPEYAYLFTAECMVKVQGGEDGAWETVIIPPELRDNLMVCDCCQIDGQIWFPSDDKAIDEIGWLVAGGDTPTEVAKEMNRLADLLPDGADAAVESLADIIREVEEEEKTGIKFTDMKMPEPEVVLEPSK